MNAGCVEYDTGNRHAAETTRQAALSLGVEAVTPHYSVAVQLFAQEAKAWARMGDRRQTEVALDKGRRLLESLPYPENLMVSRDLTKVLNDRFPSETQTRDYLDQLATLTHSS